MAKPVKINKISITGEWSTADWLDLYRTLGLFKKRVIQRVESKEAEAKKDDIPTRP